MRLPSQPKQYDQTFEQQRSGVIEREFSSLRNLLSTEAAGQEPLGSLVSGGYITSLWSYRLPGKEPCYSSAIGPVTVSDGSANHQAIIFSGYDWYIYALKISDGSLIWRKATGAPCYGRCQAGDVNSDGSMEIYGPSQDGKIWSLTSSGENRWQFSNAYDREGSGTVSSASGTTLSDSTKTWANNAFTRIQGGRENAAIEITGGTGAGQIRRILSCSGSTITINTDGDTGDYSGAVNVPHSTWTVTPDTSSTYRVWQKYSSDIYFQHAGTLVNEGGTHYLYANGFDNHVYKINANSGVLEWKYATQENMEPPPLVLSISGSRYVYVVSIDGYTRCLNAGTGALIWATNTGPADAFLSAADIDGDGSIEILIPTRYDYGTSLGGRVYLLDSMTGEIKNETTITGSWDYPDIDSGAMPINAGGSFKFITGGDSGSVWCFDSSAETRWVLPAVPNVINSTPIFHDVFGDGNICALVGDMRGTLHCIDVSSGERKGAVYVKGGIEGIPLYGDFDGDGKAEMVITTTDGYIKCFRFQAGTPHAWAGVFPGLTHFAGKQ